MVTTWPSLRSTRLDDTVEIITSYFWILCAWLGCGVRQAGCKEMPAGDVAGGALGLQHRALLARVASDAPEAGR